VIIIDRGHIGLSKKMTDLSSEGVIVMEVRGPLDQVTNALKSADGVKGVTSQSLADGLIRYEVRTVDGKDIREALAQRVLKNGWGLRLLDVRRRRLIDHFVDVINARDPLSGRSLAPSSEAVQAASAVASGQGK
jgi:ABC-2 type transport system ATP-binding protein